MTDERTGVVVAGGRSVRFGARDKTVADLAGKPLIRHAAEGLLEATDRLVVNCRGDQRSAIAEALSGLDPTFAIDEDPDRGPVGGIATGLSAVETPYAAVAAADMPLLDSGLFEYLFERATGHDAAVPRPGDWFEPLHAVYRPEPMADACGAALEEEDTRIIEPLFSLDHVVVERSDLTAHGSLDSFESVDTPDDLQWAAERLHE
jgi:molybdopterin-guanine dinucleotide biosynthesis protein A